MSTNVDLELLLHEFENTAGWDKYDMMRELREFVRNDKRDAEIFAMEQRIAELEAENTRLHDEVHKLMEETHRTYPYDGPMPPDAPMEGV